MRFLIFFILIIHILLSGCQSCSKSGLKAKYASAPKYDLKSESTTPTVPENAIRFTEKDGVLLVPIEINGVPMDFIFDTGASDITISASEALFLFKQGKLSREDIIGHNQYQIADGSISDGTVINLRTVKIGNKILENVQASIVHTLQAPLLIGQSALSRFGKITIDYNKKIITLQ